MGTCPRAGRSEEEILACRYEIEVAGQRARGGGEPCADARPEGRKDQGMSEGIEAMESAGELCEPARARRAGGRQARVALRAAPLSEAMRPVRPGLPGASTSR